MIILLIVNLTTTSERLNLCSPTLWSLVHQCKLPDKIILWVSKDKYLSDNGIESPPEFINEINSINNIIEVKFVKNTGPYRKIVPALSYFSNSDFLVYCDDDAIYGFDWLLSLYTVFVNNNELAPVASRVRKKIPSILGGYKSYLKFPLITECGKIKKDYIITGLGGVIFKKEHMSEKLRNLDDYLYLCPKADDIWFSKIFELSVNYIIVNSEALREVHEIGHSITSLTSFNNDNNRGGGGVSKLKFIYVKLFSRLTGLEVNNDISIRKVDDFFRS